MRIRIALIFKVIMHSLSLLSKVALLLLLPVATVAAAELDDNLIGHWRLTHNCRDSSGLGNHGLNKGVTFTGASAVFDGIDDHIEVSDAPSLKFGTIDTTIAVWVHTEAHLQDVVGDILSKFDPATRSGLNFSVMNYVGATSVQSNHRNVFFGIDGNQDQPKWVHCGRPGNNNMIWALTVYDGNLYAGTWEPGEGDAGHVYRYKGNDKWSDCGSPDRCNTVSALAEHDGKLYAGSSFYSGRGSAQPISPNKNPGGRVFRYDEENQWTDCGKIGDVYTVTGLVTFAGQLYATTCDSYGCPTRTEACYRYEGDKKWTFVGNPGGRLGAFLVHNGSLYAIVFGKQGFARYEGEAAWTPLGIVPNTGQTYSAVIYQGRIYLGTWPTGTVFQFDGPNRFTSFGRLGDEKEVMAMAVYNGKLYSGTLPLGKVFRYDGPAGWTDTGQLDTRRSLSPRMGDGGLLRQDLCRDPAVRSRLFTGSRQVCQLQSIVTAGLATSGGREV